MAVIGIIFAVLVGAITIGGLVSAIVVLIEAFKTSVLDGVLCLFLPFYILYFMFAKLTHRRKTLLIILIMVQPLFIGVWAALAIYGVRKYIVNAKETEARAAVMAIARNIVNASQAAGAPSELPSTTNPVPAELASVRGMKYMSTPSDWSGAWQQINFSMSDPQYFQYQWERLSPIDGVIRAVGDLNGDGTPDARFEVRINCTQQAASLSCKLPSEVAKLPN